MAPLPMAPPVQIRFEPPPILGGFACSGKRSTTLKTKNKAKNSFPGKYKANQARNASLALEGEAKNNEKENPKTKATYQSSLFSSLKK